MTRHSRREFVIAAGLAAPTIMLATRVEARTSFKVSLDTTATHVRTIQVRRYLDALRQRSDGALEAELFHSGQLFRDRDVGRALRQGGVEMAVPGTWVLTGFEPAADLVALPSLYGQSREGIYRVADGDAGRAINRSLETKLRVKVIGKWLDLGYSHTYATKPIAKPDDMAGLKIRTSGGHGQFLRVSFFGGVPNFTAWPDVPLALSQGTFDGLISTNESIASAKLWESGLKFALQDYQFYGQYVPLASEAFLSRLPEAQRKLIFDVWEEMIGGFRDEANGLQDKAAETMASNGVKVIPISPEDRAAIRRRMLPTMDKVVAELKIDPVIARMIAAAAGPSN